MMLFPYLTQMTDSEYHCFAVTNHSTIAGFVFGLLVSLGVSVGSSLERRDSTESLNGH